MKTKKPKTNLRRPKCILVSFKAFPGRTFLGKRGYFSGIVALTPLTPLTYKQNAVNAFIPTRSAVNAVSVPVERR